MGYDRYKKFKMNGSMKLVPFIEINKKNSDLYTYYEAGKSRLDLLSYQYYGDPNYGWLIMQANPELGSMEFNIEDQSKIRIPFPLSTTLTQYGTNIDKYIELYGLN